MEVLWRRSWILPSSEGREPQEHWIASYLAMTNNMLNYKQQFDAYIGVKSEPNSHELALFERAEKYIRKLEWIPGIEIIAVSNSLSMYATHKDSDIDLFIVTRPKMIWFVRFFVTLTFRLFSVWRHGRDIAGNFCLSFFITTGAMDLEKIAIEDDIYLYYWVYYLKPIMVRGDAYERFLEENTWVKIPEEQKKENSTFVISQQSEEIPFPYNNERKLPKSLQMNLKGIPNGMTKQKTSLIYIALNKIVRFFLLPRTTKSYEKLGKPWGVIIDDTMLKFHPEDRRGEIRDAILKKDFDK